MTTILDAARRYTSSGLSVIPIRLGGNKDPACESWEPFSDKIATDAELVSMFSRRVGIGIISGKVSGGLEILDFDKPGIFEEWLSAVLAIDPDAKDIIDTLPKVSTPAFGFHLFYRCAEIGGNQKLAKARVPFMDCTGKSKTTMIETRGERGYVVAPPSPKECHKADRAYTLVSGATLTNIPTIATQVRDLFFSAAKTFNEDTRPALHNPGNHGKFPSGAGRVGDDFNEHGPSWAEILEPHGWAFVCKKKDADCWRRPGKTHGLSATTGHCGDNLYVFSSNAAPFEAERTYDKFGAYTVLNNKGDFKAAARELGDQGYGEGHKQFGTVAVVEPPPDETPHTVVDFKTKETQRCLTMSDVLDLWESGGDQEAIPTPIPAMNEALAGGWPIGQVSTLVAYTGGRKTEFARQSSIHAAALGFGVIHVDIELGYKRLIERTISQATGIPPQRLRQRKEMVDEEIERLAKIMKIFRADDKMRFFCPGGAPPIDELGEMIKQEVMHLKVGKPTLIILDSVQRLAGGISAESQRLQVQGFMGFATALAKDTESAVILVSEQRRGQDGKAPTADDALTSGAESRALEFQSDVMIAMVPEDKPTQAEACGSWEETETRVQFLICKNRVGPGQGYVRDSAIFKSPCWMMSVEQRKKQAIEDMIMDAVAGVHDGSSGNEIARKIHRRTDDVKRACRSLIDVGKLEKIGDGPRSKYRQIYRVPNPGPDRKSKVGTRYENNETQNDQLPYKD